MLEVKVIRTPIRYHKVTYYKGDVFQIDEKHYEPIKQYLDLIKEIKTEDKKETKPKANPKTREKKATKQADDIPDQLM